MRPYADRMMELMAGTARASSVAPGLPAAPAPRRGNGLRRPAHRRPRAGRSLQRTGPPRGVRARAAAARARAPKVRSAVSGKKGASTLRFRSYEVERAWTGFSDRPEYADAQAMAHHVAELYAEGEVDSVRVVYNHFESRARAAGRGQRRSCPIPEHVLEQTTRPRSARRSARRLHLRAGARADPRAPAARLRRDRDLPRAARVGRVRAGRADDRDAERVEERRRADRRADARR